MSNRRITAAIITAAIYVVICITAGIVLSSIDGGERFAGSVFIIINGLAMIAQLIIRMNDGNKRKTALAVIIEAAIIIVAVGFGIMFKNIYGDGAAAGYYRCLLSAYLAAVLTAGIFMIKIKKIKKRLACQTNVNPHEVRTDNTIDGNKYECF